MASIATGPLEHQPPAPGGGRATQTVLALFEAWAARTPDAIACRFGERTRSYRELSERSTRLALQLRARGVARGVPVAVCVEPSKDIVDALLAVLKAGGVYMPLDPSHPQSLIDTMVAEARPRVVLTQPGLLDVTHRVALRVGAVQISVGSAGLAPTTASSTSLTTCPGPDDPASLLYTSGTTGKPKGVVAHHRNLAHCILSAQRAYRFCRDDVFCSLARYTFSISLFELLSPLCCGGTLLLMERDAVLQPRRLSRTLQQVTVVHAGPSLLSSVFRYLEQDAAAPQTFPNIRHASSGGDVVPPSVLETMKAVFARAEVYVIYGCTEISCMGCTYRVSRDRKVETTLVGKPFASVEVCVLDASGCPVHSGDVGEIFFAGDGVVPGYFERDDLTADRFADRGGARHYQTGDLGRWHPSGDLEFLGRVDFQVKIRGVRIELFGIENTIRELGLASQCALTVKRVGDQDVRLVAYVVPPAQGEIMALRAALAQRLPEAMLPQHVVVLDALPLTVNGKLDRRALDGLPWEPRAGKDEGVAPRDLTEQRVADAFARTLGLPGIGIDDNFFDLGGHSLSAVLVSEQLENLLGVVVPPALVFKHPTARALAEHAHRSDREHRPILLTRSADNPALFLIAGVHLYRELAAHLEGYCSVYGVYAGRELDVFESPDHAPLVADLAEQYVQIIRRQQPHGPYRLGGMSFGGLVVYEVAQRLRAAGQRVAFLGMLDAILPEHGLRARLGQLGRLATLSRPSLRRFVYSRVRSRVRRLVGVRGGARFGRFAADDKLNSMELARARAYEEAASGYRDSVRAWPGTAILVVAGQRLRDEPLTAPGCGWARHVRHLETHVIDAGHLELLQEPSVGSVAQTLLQGLSQS